MFAQPGLPVDGAGRATGDGSPVDEHTMNDIPVVILCGGMGTRMREETTVVPKPMVTVGGRPLLWHLMKFYSAQGFKRFVLCLGYKAEVIKGYFLNYREMSGSFTVDCAGDSEVVVASRERADHWIVSCVDTGEHAMTGARVRRIRDYVGDSRFMLTYGDGLSDIDLHQLLAAHVAHGKTVTVTGVHPPSRFGLLTLNGDEVVQFAEKPQTQHDYINGGFFVCEPKLFDYLDDDDACVLERGPLERVARDGEMRAFLHSGFWQCVDTIRDRELLEDLWARGGPWKKWQ
jgi:glucose-1-phosphate cytidylyltransferase